ncbi:MAG: SIMPL domain-containing protein [Acidobacteriota bacterium]
MTYTTRSSIRFAIVGLILSLCGSAALGQEPADKTIHPTIRVTGDATVTVKPDQAEISIGVVTQSQTAQAAAAQNAQKQDTVISELRKVLGSSAEIKTISYSLSPNYRYPKEGGQPTISGYTASNIVQVKTANLEQVGKVIDLATGSGANNIQSLRFTLKDEQAARTQALQEASTKARSKAQAIASALGLKIQRILRVEEGGPTTRPMMEYAAELGAMRAQAATTPIESGSIDVRATVTLTVEVAP